MHCCLSVATLAALVSAHCREKGQHHTQHYFHTKTRQWWSEETGKQGRTLRISMRRPYCAKHRPELLMPSSPGASATPSLSEFAVEAVVYGQRFISLRSLFDLNASIRLHLDREVRYRVIVNHQGISHTDTRQDKVRRSA
ncbi:hypothetical protein BaRGS_00006730 [Batillaria attramentaria]|uniref:Secreted protein n=1 Tax=Batillaria attramentaria TaxID=370345 RepID=A0ABD0LSC5_9CAEN